MTYGPDSLYKVLRGGQSCHGGTGRWTPGRWRYVRGEIEACSHGIHYCKGSQVLGWLDAELWEFEDGGSKCLYKQDKCVTDRGRVTARIETWNEETARLFAVDCARVAVNRYTQGGQRELLHSCLDVTTGYALGYPDDAAWAAARAAARDAAQAAARAAAWAAAGAAARDEQFAILLRYLNGEQGPFVESDQ